ncbi:VirB8/TrbF family protein [Pseudovibrio sp. Tun.PSC04-5.I4]|uniref:VirB8/TrbF family protein n=1 Tax=Pseudovibrio sp. Tun.PSC04-5.I4 TaxID=1798213 RepID=UPI00088437E2|nr:VirB8/TrbF family protein [Pseudovibrio sp. Tun.PSC04-5.I4]SDR49036.1 type IV secretion system protein VirB8 [Pseudovibrio sp. Tun.PSC04-5.I4]
MFKRNSSAKALSDAKDLGSPGEPALAGAPPIEPQAPMSIEPHSFREVDEFAFRSSHRRIAWFLKLSVGLNIIFGLATASVSQALIEAYPLKETRIALLRADPADNRIYRVEPISQEVDGFEMMLEQFSRRYVSLTLPIDNITQNERFKEAMIYSDRKHWSAFLDKRKENIADALKDGLNRSIIVHSSNFIAQYGDVWQYSVEFSQIDELERTPRTTRQYRAYLELTTRPQEIKEAELYENPLGIRVVGMVVKEKTL